MREARLDLNLAALRHNFAVVRQQAPDARVLAMVKADAYGHGARLVAEALPEADGFGVAYLAEAVALREAGIRQPIAVLEGVFSDAELAEALRLGLQVVVHQVEQLQLLECCPLQGRVDVWLKLDTGMHRLGFPPAQALAAFERLRACAQVGVIGLVTHFARADETDCPQTVQQIERFRQVHGQLSALAGQPLPASLANSAGILAWPLAHADWVRPGIMLYGSSPFADRSATELGLRPVMTLRSRLIAINPVSRGEPVGYGGTWVAERDTRLGIVAIGYGDGYPRHARSGTPVLVNGHEVPLAGRVAMDMITVDLGELPARPGDAVVLWGEGLAADRVAACAGTISYELFCKITARVPRHVLA